MSKETDYLEALLWDLDPDPRAEVKRNEDAGAIRVVYVNTVHIEDLRAIVDDPHARVSGINADFDRENHIEAIYSYCE